MSDAFRTFLPQENMLLSCHSAFVAAYQSFIGVDSVLESGLVERNYFLASLNALAASVAELLVKKSLALVVS